MIAFALDADTINAGREAMLALGCIQAQNVTAAAAPSVSRHRAAG
jgi:glutamate synthase domain-containing protein 2